MCSGSRRSRSSDREHAKGSRPDQGSRRIHARWTAGPEVREWYSHQESNLDQRFRKPPLYPFELWEHVGWAPAATARGPALCFDEATRQAASPPRPGRRTAPFVASPGALPRGDSLTRSNDRRRRGGCTPAPGDATHSVAPPPGSGRAPRGFRLPSARHSPGGNHAAPRRQRPDDRRRLVPVRASGSGARNPKNAPGDLALCKAGQLHAMFNLEDKPALLFMFGGYD